MTYQLGQIDGQKHTLGDGQSLDACTNIGKCQKATGAMLTSSISETTISVHRLCTCRLDGGGSDSESHVEDEM